MSSFRTPDLLERRNNAATVKKVMLEKFRAARQEPAFEQQRLKRIAVNEARAARAAEREAAKKVRANSGLMQRGKRDAASQKRMWVNADYLSWQPSVCIPQVFHINDDILVIIVRFAKDGPIPKSEQ